MVIWLISNGHSEKNRKICPNEEDGEENVEYSMFGFSFPVCRIWNTVDVQSHSSIAKGGWTNNDWLHTLLDSSAGILSSIKSNSKESSRSTWIWDTSIWTSTLKNISRLMLSRIRTSAKIWILTWVSHTFIRFWISWSKPSAELC
jgi:hypothetical protein